MAGRFGRIGLVLVLASGGLPGSNGLPLLYANVFFSGKEIQLVTGLLCNKNAGFELTKIYAKNDRRSNFAIVEELTLNSLMNVTNYSVPKVGVILDMSCDGAQQVLLWASENRLFDQRRHWLIFTNESYTQEELEVASEGYHPEMFDPQEYLDIGNDAMKRGAKIAEFNSNINKDLLKDLAREEAERQTDQTNISGSDHQLKKYIDLTALVDSEVTLAVPIRPDEGEEGYNMYEVHRKTIYTKMLVQATGLMQNGSLHWVLDPSVTANLRRTDFQGAVMKTATALLHFVYFSRSGELTEKVYDTWAQGGLQISQLVETQANFRMLVKTFDEYGWVENGRADGMVGWLGEKGAEFTASGMLLTTVRMGVIDYFENVWFQELGIIFQQPALSQVANIFVLPFSTEVWLSGLGVLILAIVVLFWQLKATNQLGQAVQIADIVTFFTAAACQQGMNLEATTVAVRVTMLVFDLTSLFLFTSYSANIVALLQSPSNRINSIPDLTTSSLEVAVENLPYQIRLFEEETSPIVKELCRKKLTPKHERAYVNVTYGVSRVRNELFAFHGELSTAYKEVSLTFTETEKCHLKSIYAFPHRYNGPAVSKNSPYRESLKLRYYWVRETGLMSRTINRWLHKKPPCNGDSGGFSSVGMLDMLPVFLVVIYGFSTAAVLLFLERAYIRFKKGCFIHLNNGKIKMNKGEVYPRKHL